MAIPARNRRKSALIIACLVALAAFLVYLPALRNDFVNWDDDDYVYQNTAVQHPGLRLFTWAFSDFHAANWHPLTWLSHGLDVAVWGLNPLGHHLTNNLLHAANSFLVVLLMMKLLELAGQRTAAGSLPVFLSDRGILLAAGSGGLLFAIHPIHVESVAWVSERKDLLCGLFFFLGILLYLHGQEEERVAQRRPSLLNRRSAAVLGCFLAALLSKPMAVSFPLVLLLLDWYPLNRFRSSGAVGRIALEKAPLLLLSLGSAAVTVLAQRSGSAIASLEFAPLDARVLVAARAFCTYLLKLVAPLKLAPLYPYPRQVHLSALPYLLTVLLVLTVASLCLIPWQGRRPWSAFWGYYAITLLPVIGLVQIGYQSMADRYTYLPSLAPLFAMGLFMSWAWHRINKLPAGIRKWLRAAGPVGLALVLLALSWLTVAQIGIWRNSFTLWNYELAMIPTQNPVAYYHRGMAYAQAKDFEAAINDYTTAISQNPDFYEAYNNRAVLFDALDRPEPAIKDYSRSLALKPHFQVYYNRGASYARLGMYREAIQDFTESLSLKPENAGAYVNRAFAYRKLGEEQQALLDFEKGCSMGNEVGCRMVRGMNTRQRGNGEKR